MQPVVFGTQNACGVLPLSPREERAGREPERGGIDKKRLLSPTLSSFLRRRGRECAVTRSKQIFCRPQLVTDRRSLVAASPRCAVSPVGNVGDLRLVNGGPAVRVKSKKFATNSV